MRIGDLTESDISDALRHGGLAFRTGPFAFRLHSSLPEHAGFVRLLYRDFPIVEDGLLDFHVRLGRAASLKSRVLGQIESFLSGASLLGPTLRRVSPILLESSLNACIYKTAHQHLVVHCACMARDDKAILFPGDSGTGKSTLTAALTLSGWRLLSDELAVVRASDGALLPLARPLSLKNDSIRLIGDRFPGQVFGPASRTTLKGDVAHMRPPAESVAAMDRPAWPRAVVFITYQPGATATLEPYSRARSFFVFAANSINYHVRGRDGFLELARTRRGMRMLSFAVLFLR